MSATPIPLTSGSKCSLHGGLLSGRTSKPPAGVDGWLTLGQARQGDSAGSRSRPWSSGAGSGALATGIVQSAWVLERVEVILPEHRSRCIGRSWRLVAGREFTESEEVRAWGTEP
jgi:hypothetical protein